MRGHRGEERETRESRERTEREQREERRRKTHICVSPRRDFELKLSYLLSATLPVGGAWAVKNFVLTGILYEAIRKA